MSSQDASSNHSPANNSIYSNNNEPIEPRRMDLSLNDTDGSLTTASLFQVLLAATGSLHQDISDMVVGELDVNIINTQERDDQQQETTEETTTANNTTTTTTTVSSKKERMSSMSFAQRRHELSWRLSSNGKSIQQVCALTAAAASTDLASIVNVSTRALQHTRTAWVQADEAQDNLYFFHAQLYPKRAPPHDVYGAADLLLARTWYDLPRDLLLESTDRYQMSVESQYSSHETDQRWQLAVRKKLLLGGEMVGNSVSSTNNTNKPPLWKISLKGGVVKLTYNNSNRAAATTTTNETSDVPLEALLTVLPSPEEAAWTLLSLNVRVKAKTGEFNHQLELSNRQRYDLHRIASLAMQKEEQKQGDNDNPKRPLHALFSVAHSFMLSWQLELLSAQAQALRRGVWAAAAGQPISVSPVQFDSTRGVVYISFWKVDDSYGTPRMEDLQNDDSSLTRAKNSNRTFEDCPHPQQLTLAIVAEFGDAMRVSLSGGDCMRDQTQMIDNLLQAASNPLSLSASDALWAATKLCSYYRCQAVYDALQASLPECCRLSVDKGSIAVACRIHYHGVGASSDGALPVLFRLMCDLRTGTFVTTFPRSFHLLRDLACNDPQASLPMSLRVAALPPNRRRASGAASSGRVVRDAFDSLIRSMDLLGQRCGVGGTWNDRDDQSSKLRDRAVAKACEDVQTALLICCGMAALYGLVPVAMSTAVGLEAIPDMAGFAIESIENYQLLEAPPVSVLVDQEIVEKSTVNSDGVSKKTSYIDQNLVSLACAVSTERIMLLPLEITVKLDSPTAFPERCSASLLSFPSLEDKNFAMNGNGHNDRPSKRQKHDNCDSLNNTADASIEISRLSALLVSLLESDEQT